MYACGYNGNGTLGVGDPKIVGEKFHRLQKVILPQQQQAPQWMCIAAGGGHTACTVGGGEGVWVGRCTSFSSVLCSGVVLCPPFFCSFRDTTVYVGIGCIWTNWKW